ncbi:PREDICTED: uncharacterized protein At4g08330, chloroplastic isoform X2 [Tarenaya hassleriana]|uniref:uncharacterized protein At4g08330, chloroplastic isoform X2 n=1 Tax=Tarenaya hassleriana TaxID=28532 RepID=UPI00053C9FEE|nr:PREDICTED: uncharacterized protein At4g08330, chloroplastic isoform X2 [Tarenaya hassleriana]
MVRFDSVGANDVRLGGSNQFSSPSFSSSSSLRHVNYSCGSCGYELNLSSSNRITSTIGSKYGKSIKSGIISFFNIDESRFTQDKASAHTVVAESSDSSPSDVGSGIKKYDIRIRALQPSSSAQGIGAPFFS